MATPVRFDSARPKPRAVLRFSGAFTVVSPTPDPAARDNPATGELASDS